MTHLILMVGACAGALAAPGVAWRTDVSGLGAGVHDPAAAFGLVLVGSDDGRLRALRPADGAEAWVHRHISGKRIFHRPVADADRAYFTNHTHLVAVTPAGRTAWDYEVGAGAGACAVVPGRDLVVTAGGDGTVHAVDRATGARRWTADFLADAPPDPPKFDGARARINDQKARPTGVTADADTAYLSVFDQCRVVAFDLATGKKRWSYQTGGWVLPGPTVAGKYVLVSSQDRHVHCLDKATGAKVWAFKTNWRVESGAAVDGADVFVPSCDGRLYRLNLADGEPVWTFEAEKLDGRRQAIYSTPVVTASAVYFAAENGKVVAVDRATGRGRWAVPAAADSETFCSPVAVGNLLIVTTCKSLEGKGVHAIVAVRPR